jgi:hypothetical protein
MPQRTKRSTAAQLPRQTLAATNATSWQQIGADVIPAVSRRRVLGRQLGVLGPLAHLRACPRHHEVRGTDAEPAGRHPPPGFGHHRESPDRGSRAVSPSSRRSRTRRVSQLRHRVRIVGHGAPCRQQATRYRARPAGCRAVRPSLPWRVTILPYVQRDHDNNAVLMVTRPWPECRRRPRARSISCSGRRTSGRSRSVGNAKTYASGITTKANPLPSPGRLSCAHRGLLTEAITTAWRADSE